MRRHDLLERHEALPVGQVGEPRQQRRDLHAGEPTLTGHRIADRGREVQREVRDVRERMRGVDRQRCQHREDALAEPPAEELPVLAPTAAPSARPGCVPSRAPAAARRARARRRAPAAPRPARGSPRAARAGVMPSGVVAATPASTCSSRPDTRIWKNSSRFWAKIATNFTRSSSGRAGSSASASTRASNSSQESSRFRKRAVTSIAGSGKVWASTLALHGTAQRGRARLETDASTSPRRPEGRSVHELVPEAAHGDQVPRVVRIVLDLLADPLHVHVERLRVADVVGAPDLLDQEQAG